jgi:LemA protein
VSEDVLKTIGREVTRQTRELDKIRSQLDESRILRRQKSRESDFQQIQVGAQQNAQFAQKVVTLARVHQHLTNVGAGVDALTAQYPALHSWLEQEQFRHTVRDAEESLEVAKRRYNSNVSMYNQILDCIPWSFVAAICHFDVANFYEIDGTKGYIKVQFRN